MKNHILFVLIANILVAGVLFWIGTQRMEDFRQYHHAIASESVSGVAESTARFITETNRLVALFAQNELTLIRALARDPENSALHSQLQQHISRYFPDHFTFTLSDVQGEPLFEDFDGLIGEVCKIDLLNYAEVSHSPARIHPNAEAYHFDVMSHFGDNEGILFISFHADVLGNILKAAQTTGHELILALEQSPQLIEVTALGARNKLDRDDYRLSAAEKSRILEQKFVPGTSWLAMDLNQPDLFADFQQQLLQRSSAVFILFLFTSLLFLVLMRTAEKRRQEAEQTRDEFLAMVSHELRTPLTAIRGALGLITGGVDKDLPTQTTKLARLAQANTDQMIELVNELLDIRKLESGDMVLEMNSYNLSAIVKRSMELNREFGAQFGVSYQFTAGPENLQVMCNEQRISQVITNLLSNAAKYGAHNSTVEISIEVEDQLARVKVRDYGTGIPAHFRKKVFNKFTQADSSDKRSKNGSGLGLSIAKHIVDLHGGKIGFDTITGAGTIFYFELPLKREPA